MKKLFKSLFASNFGYIKLTEDRVGPIYINTRAILRYESYTYSFYPGDKSTINSRLWYLDKNFVNLEETPEQIHKLISEVVKI